MKRYSFLRYWLIQMLVLVGLLICWNTDVFSFLWNGDVTKISFLILSLFTIMSVFCGIKTWKLSGISKNDLNLHDGKLRLSKVKRRSELGWFAVNLCVRLGLLGTVLGLVVMFGGTFKDLNVSNVEEVQKAALQMGVGMSTALLTTAVGLLCSILLELQYTNLDNSIKYLESK